MSAQRAAALNARRHEKNTLKGFFDLVLPSGMIVKGCTLHVAGRRAWVGLPGRPYTDASGAETWANIIEFRGRTAKERFQKIALDAAAEVFPEAAEHEEQGKTDA
jgi:hypothetical protein